MPNALPVWCDNCVRLFNHTSLGPCPRCGYALSFVGGRPDNSVPWADPYPFGAAHVGWDGGLRPYPGRARAYDPVYKPFQGCPLQ
jgi:hypothetical protein